LKLIDNWVNKLIKLFKIFIKINLEETLFEFSHVISVRIFFKKPVYSIIKTKTNKSRKHVIN
jgi:hypothetical protein